MLVASSIFSVSAVMLQLRMILGGHDVTRVEMLGHCLKLEVIVIQPNHQHGLDAHPVHILQHDISDASTQPNHYIGLKRPLIRDSMGRDGVIAQFGMKWPSNERMCVFDVFRDFVPMRM